MRGQVLKGLTAEEIATAEAQAAQMAKQAEEDAMKEFQQQAKIKAAEEAARIAAEEAAAQKAYEEEAARVKAEAEAQIEAQQEAARMKAEEDAKSAEAPMSLLFVSSHGNSTMLSVTDRVRQVRSHEKFLSKKSICATQ